MPNDHYVAQTYLKSFEVELDSKRVNAIGKPSLKEFTASTEDICRKANWSTSPYHQENTRIVEDYLKIYERAWRPCMQALEANTFDKKVKAAMTGYIAFLRACTPKAVRVNNSSLEQTMNFITQPIIQSEVRKIKDPMLRKRIQCAGVRAEVDPNFSKGMSFRGAIGVGEKYGNFPWSILYNETSTPFITSDNPLCIIPLAPTVCKFYMPLTPRLGLIIDTPIIDNPKLEDHFLDINEDGVQHYNDMLAKNAESMVIFNVPHKRVAHIVEKNRNWQVDSVVSSIGPYIISQELLVDVNTKLVWRPPVIK
jgi:hypothetical protein